MKIGIISDSPTVTTGFGITTDQIARGLAAAGHEVVCFGIKAYGETFDRSSYPFRIWTISVGEGTGWSSLLVRFLDYERLDALLINSDLYNMKEILDYCRQASWRGSVIAYVILDGVPAYRAYLENIANLQVHLASTRFSARYLEENGYPDVAVAPPGVDRSVFKPLPEARSLRRRAGLEDRFVIGVFGRNTERKQQARVLNALDYLRRTGAASDLLVYFHCNPRAYWHLDEIAETLGIRDRVLFAGDTFEETAGVDYVGSARESAAPAAAVPCIPADYSYVERMNCCDLIVNVAHCGDFEQVIIEANACGVPLAATDDQGIMSEAMGEGGLLLEPADVSYGGIGQKIYMVNPEAVARAILAVKENGALRDELRRKGMENAMKYPWERLRSAIVEAVAGLERLRTRCL
jgi:glycosyltransferase involved in cell wall biosynthesis